MWFKNKKTKEIFEVVDANQVYDLLENIKNAGRNSTFKKLRKAPRRAE